MSKATLVSIYPREVFIQNTAINPGDYRIEPGSMEKPGILVVEDAQSQYYVDEQRGFLKVTEPAEKIAESLVHDYLTSMVLITDTRRPGILWFPGVWTSEELLKDPKKKLALQLAQIAQVNWYTALVAEGDNFWSTSHNHLSVNDLHKTAARELKISERPWMLEQIVESTKSCPACNVSLSGTPIVCPNCKVILDKERHKEFAFAS